MDIAAFEVSHSVRPDKEAAALRAARARSSSTGAMDASSGKVQKASTHPACGVRIHVGVNQRYRALDVDPPTLPAARTTSVSIGAMKEMSRKVQNASSHILRRQNHEHAHSSQSVQGPVQGSDGGNVWEGSKCKHSPTGTQKSRARAHSSRSVQGLVQGGNGPLHAWVRFGSKLT
jgi:hypothetical protein